MDFVNRLPVDTSIHNHGAYADGDSEDKTKPGASKRYVYLNEETSRFQWYHDLTAHVTAVNVYRGLAGLFCIGTSSRTTYTSRRAGSACRS